MTADAQRVILWGSQGCELGDASRILERNGYRVREVDSFESLRRAIEICEVDLVVARLCSCFQLPLELLTWLQRKASPPPVLIVTGAMDVHLYLEAMRRGAFDCVCFPPSEAELLRLVSFALKGRPVGVLAQGGGR